MTFLFWKKFLDTLEFQDQYEFCHHVLADFLDGFDTYANFKEII